MGALTVYLLSTSRNTHYPLPLISIQAGRLLVSRGADVLLTDNQGDSPLSLCLEFGYDYLVPTFIRYVCIYVYVYICVCLCL